MPGSYIAEPFQFNPLKHHLGFIREIVSTEPGSEASDEIVRQIRHTGTSVMDIYTGKLSVNEVLAEVRIFLDYSNLKSAAVFARWAGTGYSDFRITTLTDGSEWTLKYNQSENRYVHLFPARMSIHTFRVKANTLKSAMLYIKMIGKDFVTEDDLNRARAMAGLSPVKEVAETEAISEMIEILRSG